MSTKLGGVKAVARATVQVKAEGTDQQTGNPVGYFDATVAVYDNVDYQNDVLEQNAFDASLKDWQASGDPIPVIWSHMWDDPFAHIGYVDSKNVSSDAAGLHVKDAVLDLTNPMAQQVYALMKGRRVKEFSFGYDPTEFDMDGDVRHLHTVALWELGPTLKGANPATVLEDVKAANAQDASGSVGIVGGDDDAQGAGTHVLDVPDDGNDTTDDDPDEAKAASPEVAAAVDTLTALVEASGSDDDAAALATVVAAIPDEPAPEATTGKALKVGRVLSSKNETDLTEARDLITKVLASVQRDDQADKDKRATTGTAASRDDPKPKSLGQLTYDIAVAELGGLE